MRCHSYRSMSAPIIYSIVTVRCHVYRAVSAPSLTPLSRCAAMVTEQFRRHHLLHYHCALLWLQSSFGAIVYSIITVRCHGYRAVSAPSFTQLSRCVAMVTGQFRRHHLLYCHVALPWLQGSFGAITYSIVGVDTAPSYFQIDSQSGSVTLSRSLATDTLTEYRVRRSS